MRPFILGMPRFPSPPEKYDRANEAQFRQLVERLLQSTVNQTNSNTNSTSQITETLQFIPDNTVDVGDIATPYRPKTGYFATSVVAPLFSGNTLSLSGSGTLGGALSVGGATTIQSSSLTINGVTYTWPSSQTANRVLRNTGPGTLAWSQVDLTTDITGIIPSANVSGAYSGITGVGTLASGAVPASLVTAGTFGAGAYTFPSTLLVTTTLTSNGSSASLAQSTTTSQLNVGSGTGSGVVNLVINGAVGQERAIQWSSASTRRWRLIANTTAESGANAGSSLTLVAYDDAGSSIDTPWTLVRAASGLSTFSRPTTFTNSVRIGSGTPTSDVGFYITTGKTLTGATTTYGTIIEPIADSGVTSAHHALAVQVRTAAAAYTVSAAYGVRVLSGSLGAGSAVTNLYGLYVNAVTAGGTNYALYTNAGLVRFGDAVTMASTLDVTGAITGGTYNGQTISSAASFTGTLTVADAITIQGTSKYISWVQSAVERTRIQLLGVGTNGGTLRFFTKPDGGAITETFTLASTGAATFAGSLAITGALSGVTTLSLSGQLTSTLATGTAPLVVASTTKVANLNADLLDDQSGAYYNDAANLTGTVASARLSGSYTGITGVGTLTAGTWNASVISEAYGGTNQSTYALGDLLYASATNTLSKLAGNTTTTPQYLRQTGNGSVSAAPVWDTLTAADVGAGTFAGSFIFSGNVQANNGVSANDLGVGTSAGTVQTFLNVLSLYGAGVVANPNGNSTATRLSGNSVSATGAYLDLWGTTHANAGRVDLVSGGTADLNLTAGSGTVKVTTDLQVASGKVYKVNGTQVVKARITGYTNAMTGTADRATAYATSTITLQQLAERVKALEDDLTTHGLIGA